MTGKLSTLAAAQLVIAGVLLARSLVAAKLLGPSEFGVAASFALVCASVEGLTALGLTQIILRETDGNDRRLIPALHVLQIVRGLVAAGAILLIVVPLSSAFDMAHARAAFFGLAAVPMLLSVQHLDQHRAARSGNYRPMILVQLCGAVVSLGVLVSMHDSLPDHRAMLAALVAHAMSATLVSHIVALGPYRCRYDRKITHYNLRFGGPILLNGILLVGVTQGEKFVTGIVLGSAGLGLLAACLTITLAPAMVFSKAQQTHFLPRVESEKAQSETRRLAVGATLAAFILCIMSIVGAYPMSRLFGAGYGPLATLLPITGLLGGLRILRGAVATKALSTGRSSIPLCGNLLRIIALPMIYLTLRGGGDLSGALWIAVLAEFGGLAVTSLLLHRVLHRARWAAAQC